MRCVFPIAVPTANEIRIQAAIEALSEAEFCDSRFVLVLAYARIHTAIDALVDQRAVKQTNGRRPDRFKTASSALNRAGCFEHDYYSFLRKLRWIRNQVCHSETRVDILTAEPFASDLQAMHELSTDVWPHGANAPLEDLRRSVFAMCVAGVLAVELDLPGGQCGFSALRCYFRGRDLGLLDGIGRASE